MKALDSTGRLVPSPPPTSRYRPKGDGEFRDSLAATLDHFRGTDQEMGIVVAFLVEGMEMLASTALTPAAKRTAEAYADTARDFIPADVADLMRQAKMNVAAGRAKPTPRPPR